MARLRSAPVAQPPPPPKAQGTRPVLREKTNTTRTQAPVYEDDGNTEGLVKKGKPRRGQPKKSAQNGDELGMAGGLGRADSDALPTTDELAKGDAPLPPTAKANRRPLKMMRKPIQNEAQSKVLEGLKKRMEATARKEAGRKDASIVTTGSTAISSDPLPTKPAAARQSTSIAHERSEYSLSPSPPPPGKLSSVKDKRSSLAQPGSALRPQSTPAVESSILALKNFKRRPRQPSMLAMVQQRTVSARPSAVNTAASEDPSVFDVEAEDEEDEDEDEDEFAPEAEGTPLHVSKAKRRSSVSVKKKQASKLAASTQAKPPPSKKRKSDDFNNSSSALEALKAKRQKSDAPAAATEDDPLAAFQRSTSIRRSSSWRPATPQPQITSDIMVINSSPSSTPPTEPSSSDRDRSGRGDEEGYVVPSTQKESEEDLYGATPPRQSVEQFDFNAPDRDSEDLYGATPPRQSGVGLDFDAPNGTMAEPASSSPLPEVPLDSVEDDEVLADPITQITQQSPLREREKPKKKAKPISTANLQALLPKRRQAPKPRRRKTEYDFTSDEEEEGALDTSHLEDDEDELGGRLRRKTKTTPAKGRKSTVPAKTKGRASKAPQPNRKSSAAPPARKSTAPTKKPVKTYGRAPINITSDKENEGGDYEDEEEDDATDMPEASVQEATRSKEPVSYTHLTLPTKRIV